jgi:hypothetical protein
MLSMRKDRRISKRPFFLLLVIGTASVIFAQKALEPRKIQILIVTGQDKHPWRESSPYLRGILEQTGKFEVRVTEEFRGANQETLEPYDALVLDYSDEKLAKHILKFPISPTPRCGGRGSPG